MDPGALAACFSDLATMAQNVCGQRHDRQYFTLTVKKYKSMMCANGLLYSTYTSFSNYFIRKKSLLQLNDARFLSVQARVLCRAIWMTGFMSTTALTLTRPGQMGALFLCSQQPPPCSRCACRIGESAAGEGAAPWRLLSQ